MGMGGVEVECVRLVGKLRELEWRLIEGLASSIFGVKNVLEESNL